MKMTAEQVAYFTKVLAEWGPGLKAPSVWWSVRADCMNYSVVDEMTQVEFINNEICLLKTHDKGEIVGVELRDIRTILDAILRDDWMRALLLARAEKLGINLAKPVGDIEQAQSA